jgi:hypothetical protein
LPTVVSAQFSIEIELEFIDVTPTPVFTRLERPHDGVMRSVKMLRRMFIRRRIATAYMSTDKTKPQMHPAGAHFETLLAPFGVRMYVVDLIEMRAFHKTLALRIDC